MNIDVLICTRYETFSHTLIELKSYFEGIDAEVKVLINQKSIFSAYSEGLVELNQKYYGKDSIVILCHDDIRILSNPSDFVDILTTNLAPKENGFIGVAGTRWLSENAVWWDKQLWQRGYHSGLVWHGSELGKCSPTFFGEYNQAVVMDGLFLAAKRSTLNLIGLEKPESFEGDWDYYDLTYTLKAHMGGLRNLVVPIMIMHNSLGELVGRDGWQKNREAFIKQWKLPVIL